MNDQHLLSMLANSNDNLCNIKENPVDVDIHDSQQYKLRSNANLILECNTDRTFNFNDNFNDVLPKIQFFNGEVETTLIQKIMASPRWQRVNKMIFSKQNKENVLQENFTMSRKRKSTFPQTSVPVKKAKFDLKPCSVVLKKESLEILKLNLKHKFRNSYVKLYDVLAEYQPKKVPVVTKNEYMNSLKLVKNPAQSTHISQVETNCNVKNGIFYVPLSSNSGQKLLQKHHFLSDAATLCKFEKIEPFVNRLPRTRGAKYNDYLTNTYRNKCSTHYHRYVFAKRQAYQKHLSLKQGFLQYLCKPLYVVVERMDFNEYFTKENEKHKATNDFLNNHQCNLLNVVIVSPKMCDMGNIVNIGQERIPQRVDLNTLEIV